MTKTKNTPNIQAECNKILKLVKKHEDFLCKNENHELFAYIMLRWQNLYSAGRIMYNQCNNNPKYEFESLAKNDKNQDIFYDAWGVGVGMEALVPSDFLEKNSLDHRLNQLDESDFDELSKYFSQEDDFTKLQYKKNKTMDDWYALLGNPKYSYHSIYQTKHDIDDHLLCTNGNGYDWNKDGFLCDSGCSDEGRDGFGKFLLLKGNITGEGKKIEDELNEILFKPEVQKCLSEAKTQGIEQRLEFMRGNLISDLKFHFSSIAFDLVYGHEDNLENHKTLVDFVKNTFEKQKEYQEIKKLSKDYLEQWEAIKNKIPKNISFEKRAKLEKEYSTEEFQEIQKKLISFKRKLADVAEKNFSKSKITTKELIEIKAFQKKSMDDFLNSEEAKKVFGKNRHLNEREKGHYYPMSKNFCAMSNMPKNAHPSYLKASIEICLDIIQNAKVRKGARKHEEDGVKNNIKFAKEFLANHGYEEYKKDLPKVIDKYSILDSVEKLFAPIFESYPKSKIENYYEQKIGTTNLYLNDTKNNKYADDNIYCYLKLDSKEFPKGISSNPNFFEKHSPLSFILSSNCKKILKEIKKIKDIDTVFFYYENLENEAVINFQIYLKDEDSKYQKDIQKSENGFIKEGFSLSEHSIALELDEYILVTRKPKTLGSRHDMNTDGKQYFSNATYFHVYDKKWKLIDKTYDIDERGFNVFSGGKKSALTNWLKEQHAAMKASNKDYGTYSSEERNNSKEGKKHLYAHEFMLWLKQHQSVTV